MNFINWVFRKQDALIPPLIRKIATSAEKYEFTDKAALISFDCKQIYSKYIY